MNCIWYCTNLPAPYGFNYLKHCSRHASRHEPPHQVVAGVHNNMPPTRDAPRQTGMDFQPKLFPPHDNFRRPSPLWAEERYGGDVVRIRWRFARREDD